MANITKEQQEVFRAGLSRLLHFTDEEWNMFVAILYPRPLHKKEQLATQDKVCNEVGFIVQGSLRMYLVQDGLEINNYFCFENELVSSYVSFVSRQPSKVSVEAMEESLLICFSYAGLEQLQKEASMQLKMEQFRRVVAEYLIGCFEERVFAFLLQSPEQRYSSLLKQQPNLLFRVPQHYLANYLGVTPVSLSRIRKRVAQAAKQKENLAS